MSGEYEEQKALQRQSAHADARTEGSPKPNESPHIELIEASVIAAQHFFERAAGDPKVDATVSSLIGNGARELRTALRTVLETNRFALAVRLSSVIDEMRRSLLQLQYANIGADSKAALKSAMDVDSTLGMAINYRVSPNIYVGRRSRSESTGHYAASAIRATMHVVEADAALALRELVSIKPVDGGFTGDRDAILRSNAKLLVPHLEYVLSVLPTVLDARTALEPDVERATTPIVAIRSWNASRPGSAMLKGSYSRVWSLMDAVRQGLALPATGQVLTPPLEVEETEEAALERNQLDGEVIKVQANLDLLRENYQAGVTRFSDFVEISAPPSPNWDDLAIGIASAFLGNAMSPLFALAVSSIKKQYLQDALKGIGVDSVEELVQSLASKSVVASRNDEFRERKLFAESLNVSKSFLTHGFKNVIASLISNAAMSIDLLRSINASLSRSAAGGNETAFRDASAGYASLLARRTLGTASGQQPSTNLEGYFGEVGGVQPGANDKSRTALGVALAYVDLVDTSETINARITGFRIKGVNLDLATAIALRAERRLDVLGIPVELHISMEGHPRRARLVVDERGHVKDSYDWEALEPRSAMPGSPRQGNTKYYMQPDDFWQAFHALKVPEGLLGKER